MTRYAVVVIALTIGGWLLFDGVRVIVTGAYTTPGTGAYAGQLGPWSHLLEGVGIDPLSWPARLAHVALGLGWLGSGIGFWRCPAKAWTPLLVTALASLWYAPFGTIAAIAVTVMLLLPASRLAA